MLRVADRAPYTGRLVRLGGADLHNFGCCSYLGLEQRVELRDGAAQALRDFGTQFPFPRAYLECPLYEQLERSLSEITGGFVLVAPSTTLAHIAALPVLVNAGDAVLIDQFTHASVHTAANLLGGTFIATTPHNDVTAIEAEVGRLVDRYPRVWLLLDGLYSMLGDLAPLHLIGDLLRRFPTLHVYVDDAHATSWLGPHGRGYALEALPDRSRVVVALSLNKAFAAAGGALVFPTEELRMRVRTCGGPMLFSGPIQPPMLGAAVASATLHLSAGFEELQVALLQRIDRFRRSAADHGLRFAADARTPIFFFHVGALDRMYPLVRALHDAGFYVSPSGFPAVPKGHAGIRINVSLHNTLDDVENLVSTLAKEASRLGIDGTAGFGPDDMRRARSA